jgi:hypothetical protein
MMRRRGRLATLRRAESAATQASQRAAAVGAARRVAATKWLSPAQINYRATRPRVDPNDSFEELTGLLHRAYASLGAMGFNYTAVDQVCCDHPRPSGALGMLFCSS